MRKCLPLVLLLSVALLTGCASVRRTTPQMNFRKVNVKIERDDVQILDNVEGVSSVLSICGPIVQIIDDTDVRILGLSAMEDRYSFEKPPSGLFFVLFPGIAIFQSLNLSAANRAYYNALAASPDADAVFTKSYQVQKRGIPFIYMTEKVTYTGKAFKLKPDK